MEVWKNVEGFEGLYEVSNLGSIRGQRGLLKISTQRNGYKYVTLRKDGKQYHSLIHRLVAQNFIPNPNGYPEVNHISEDKEDNSVTNLEWCTHKYNHNYGTGHIRTAKKQGRKVAQLSLDGKVIQIFDSVRQASRTVNKSHKDIYNVCRGLRHTSSGYRWEYV